MRRRGGGGGGGGEGDPFTQGAAETDAWTADNGDVDI